MTGTLGNSKVSILSELRQKYVMLCAIWYHLCNLKNTKNTHGQVLLLVKLREISIFMLGCRDLVLLYPELWACGCFRSDTVLTSALGDVNEWIWFSFSGDLVVNVLPSLSLSLSLSLVIVFVYSLS